MADNSGLIADALNKTDPELANRVDVNSWKEAIAKRGARIKLYRNYERGDHRADMTTQMKKMLRLSSDEAGLTDFNANLMRTVIDKMAGRIFVSNVQTDDGSKAWMEETLGRNDFDAAQSLWYRGAIRDGDSFVMVDPKTLLWSAEPAYDGFSGIVSIFDTMTRKAIWACKLWSEADTADIAGDESGSSNIKLIVYQPNAISYWTGGENGSQVVPGEGAPSWPLGKIPIIKFSNQLDSYTNYGESELRPAIPLQDVLNRTIHSMVMASEFTAFSVLWSIGFELDVDGIVPGAVLNLVLRAPTNSDGTGGGVVNSPTDAQLEFLKAAKVGQFQGADISQYTNQIDKIVQQISHITATPMYGVTTQGNLSGEALKQLEIGLLGKVERFQHQNTDAIKELIELTAMMQNGFDSTEGGIAPDFDMVHVIWKSPEILDVNSRIATLTALREKAPGLFTDEWYIKRVGTLLGMGQSDIEDEIKNAASQAGNFFEALTGTGGGVPVV